METARWMLPSVHRAIDQGAKTVEVQVSDLKEVLAFIEASAYREKVEFAGKHLGYSCPDMVRDLLTRNRASSPVLFKKTDKYCVEIFYLELPLNANQAMKLESLNNT